MKCQDVRRALPLLVAGELPLTEWAILQTHVSGCPECQKEMDALGLKAAQRRRARTRQVAVATLVGVLALTATGTGIYLHEVGLPDYRPSFLRFRSSPPAEPSVSAAPADPEPTPAAAAAPTLPAAPPPTPAPPAAVRERPAVTPPRPAPASTPLPPQPVPRPKTVVDAPRVKTPVKERASVAAQVSADEQMPTQGAPPTTKSAPAGAESMPTQGGPAQAGSRQR